jgi:hypothetical protein
MINRAHRRSHQATRKEQKQKERRKRRLGTEHAHSFALAAAFSSFFATFASLLANFASYLSISTLLSTFPVGFFGIYESHANEENSLQTAGHHKEERGEGLTSGTTSIPPLNHLYLLRLSWWYLSSTSTTRLFPSFLPAGERTIHARGIFSSDYARKSSINMSSR